MMNRTLSVFAVGLLVATLWGCGGDSGGGAGPTCGKVQPCGGDIVGTWKIAGACTNSSTLDLADFCPTATLDSGDISVTGTVVYKADRTYSAMATTSGSIKLRLPASCLKQSGITITCAQLGEGIRQDMMKNPDPSIQSASCADSGGTCVCTVVNKPANTNETGTYTVSGTTITDTPTGSKTTDTTEYCVQGNNAHFMQVDMTMAMPMMGKVTVSADIVATRQ